MIVGYARASTEGQTIAEGETIESQIEHLNHAGCGKIYSETKSGAKTDRRARRHCLAALRPGDVLVVTRLDRLARSTRDLFNVLAEIGERSAAFRSLTDTSADTTTPHGRLMLTVLGGLAEFERELIKARTGDVSLR
jgi:DNA invertase Pin-like site-specific DNA recombinase